MLRDLKEDIPEGYINIPKEQIECYELDIEQLDSNAMRSWVKGRVRLARQYFRDGKQYLDKLSVLRCRIVGHWYCARFEYLLDTIEKDGYLLRSTYSKPHKWLTSLKFASIALEQTSQHALLHIQKKSRLCTWSQTQAENSFETISDR
jgi:phytoene/squalene synthetase